jgi:hypothetical protein
LISALVNNHKNSKASQVNRKTTALAADSKQDSLQPKISERHPIKTGADN